MDKVADGGCNTSYMGQTRSITPRQKFKMQAEQAKECIKQWTIQLKEAEAGLKLLDSNKELESLVNLLNR